MLISDARWITVEDDLKMVDKNKDNIKSKEMLKYDINLIW